MKVKKFTAATMPEVMNIIRKELGPEAVILNSKEVQHAGFLGFFKKRRIEVVAALDPQPIHILPTNQVEHPKIKLKPVIKNSNIQKDENNLDVLNEIKHLKKVLEKQAFQSKKNFPPDYELIYQYLLDQEVDSHLAEELINEVIKGHENTNTISPNLIVSDIELEIEKRLSEVSLQGITYSNKIIQFVGPTGVGKTTTIAKVAANSILKDRKKVAFITTDTYRIAAIDQLKTYAQILDIPIEVAYTIDDYKSALENFSAYDLILVDTAGRNFRDEKYIKELKNMIDFELDMETYLVLSLTAKAKDITEIYDQFHHLSIKNIIFTKIDETRQYGSILNITLNHHVGVAYLTNGQDVPDDLIQPTPQKISKLLVGGYSEA